MIMDLSGTLGITDQHSATLSFHYCAVLSSIFGLHQVGIEQSHDTEPPAAESFDSQRCV